MNKLQAAEQLRRALQMFAQTLGADEAMEVATVYDAWQIGKAYKVGEYLTYGANGVGDPQLYKVVQAHTSQSDWTPDKTPALYTEVAKPGEIPVWKQPTGAHDAYNTGDKVHYPTAADPVYVSTIDANVYAPDVYGWEKE